MPVILDTEASAQLVPLGAAITADTTYGVVTAWASLLPTAVWAINVTTSVATGSYTMILEAADVEAGPYAPIARLDWPSGKTGSHQVALGASASAARASAGSSRVRYLRVRALLGGATPSLTWRSWLGKPANAFGLASKPGATLSVV
jgi:hypothetical protein